MAEAPVPDGGSAGDARTVGYADALRELEEILSELEGDAVDVDRLASRVARAAVLIESCRARIETARMDVARIVGEPGQERGL
ncbi:MAG: exodeoxyribonuclease VII small subunit [Acidimicrobiia bacterium]